MGSTSAAAVAGSLRVSFPNIKLGLVVGICGGIPYGADHEEIVLGDVVISQALVQYDLGRQYPGGFKRKTDVRDTLGRPSPQIRAIQAKLGTHRYKQRMQNNMAIFLREIQGKLPKTSHPGQENDILYHSSYVHQHHSPTTCDVCKKDDEICRAALETECEDLGCESTMRATRNRFMDASATQPIIHFGIMGSGNTVMKSGQHRDRMAQADGIIAFEMEGAGVWDYFPSIVIKGVCDYADSHKRKGWLRYAAATAAACMKAFLVEWSVENVPAASGELSRPVWHVPFDHMPGFIGRTAELNHLKQKVLTTGGRRIASILGLGGIGKSRLALELVNQIQLENPHYAILWIQAVDHLTFGNDVLEIGRKFRVPGIEDDQADIKALVKQHLCNSSADPWLLILDNADDEAIWGRKSNPDNPQATLVDWIPSTKNGFVLITTRSRRVASYLAAKEVIELHAMSAAEAKEMFLNTLEKPEMAVDQHATSALLDKLIYLPLAIVQAASYMNMTQEPVETYLELMGESEEEVIRLLSEDFGDWSRYSSAHNAVATTWLISFEQIRKYHSSAERFLSFMACLHEKSIPQSLLPEIGSKKDVLEAIDVLRGYSFLTRHTRDGVSGQHETLYDMHRLVHLAARNWQKMGGSLSESTKACILHVAQVFPSRGHEHRSIWTTYMPHAQRLCEDSSVGDIPERFQLLEKVVAWREHEQGTSDEQTLKAYSNLGEALTQQGELSLAKRYLQNAVDGQVDKLGKENSSTLASMNHLAEVLSAQGQYPEAEKMFREVLQLSETVLGKSQTDTLVITNSLAEVLSSQGQYSKAEQIHREVLRLREMVPGKSHLNTLNSINNLALVLSRQGQYSDAESMFREVLQSSETVLGKSHPRTLISMSNLAGVLSSQGQNSEADKIHREALQLRETVLGKNHPETLISMINLAIVLSRQGQDSDAESMFREVLQLSETVLDKCHPDALTTMNNLAEVLSSQGQDPQAEKIHREVLQLRETVLGKSHPDTLTTMNNLAEVLRRQSQFSEAEKIHREVLQLREAVLGKSHPATLTTMNNLAFVLSSQGQKFEAEKMFREVLQLSETVLGKSHPSILIFMENSAALLSRQGAHPGEKQ